MARLGCRVLKWEGVCGFAGEELLWLLLAIGKAGFRILTRKVAPLRGVVVAWRIVCHVEVVDHTQETGIASRQQREKRD